MNQITDQIFIGGCGRSGTTLLGAMLGGHPAAICTPESHFKIDLLRSPLCHKESFEVEAALILIRRHWRFKIWEFDLPASVLIEARKNPTYAHLLNSIVGSYGGKVGRNKHEKRIWVDHTPENISYVANLLSHFPQAKFLHIVRDGRAVAASIMPLDWGPNSIVKTSRWWMRMVSLGLAAELKFGPDRVLRVKYEDLVMQSTPTLEKITKFLGIEYHPRMLEATGFTPPTYTSRQHTLVGQKPNLALVSRWKEKLSPREIEIFEHLTYDFLCYMGYEMEYGIQAKAPGFGELQKGKLVELFQGEILNKIKWLVRSYPHWLSRDFLSQARFSDLKN